MATATYQQGIGGYSDAEDTYIRANQAVAFGAETTMLLGYKDAFRAHLLLRFNNIPYLGAITGAKITLTLDSGAEDPATDPWVKIARVLASPNWNEVGGSPAHWGGPTQADSWNTPGCMGADVDYDSSFWCVVDPYTVLTGTGTTRDFVFNSVGVAYVHEWQGGGTNNGVIFLCGEDAAGWEQWWRTRDHGTAADRPKLTLTYTPGTQESVRPVRVIRKVRDWRGAVARHVTQLLVPPWPISGAPPVPTVLPALRSLHRWPPARPIKNRLIIPPYPASPATQPPYPVIISRGRRTRQPTRISRSRVLARAAFRGKYYHDGRGLYRVFNAATYRFYRSNSAPPVEGDSPFATNATLPHTPADTYANGLWWLSVSYFNGVIDSGFLPLGPAGETYLRLRVLAGYEFNVPPNGPLDWRLEARASGVVRVVGVYWQGDALRATQWAIAYTTDGSSPPAGTPDETVTMPTGGLAVLAYDLPGQANGTTVKVRLQTRRQDGPTWWYSEGSTVKTRTADAAGPTVPLDLEAWPGRLPE